MTKETTCQFCGVSNDEHNYEHLARECYPIRVKKLEELAEAQAKEIAELRKIGAAIDETLDLADFLNGAAARGAGFADHWGERVMQAVQPLCNIEAFNNETLRHNRSLLDYNGQLITERDSLRQQLTAKEQEIERVALENYNVGMKAAADALREKDAEIESLKGHLPDCCKNETCDQDENILPSDVAALTMNSAPFWGRVATQDEWIDMINKIADLSHKAVKAAIADREKQLADLRARLDVAKRTLVELKNAVNGVRTEMSKQMLEGIRELTRAGLDLALVHTDRALAAIEAAKEK